MLLRRAIGFLLLSLITSVVWMKGPGHSHHESSHSHLSASSLANHLDCPICDFVFDPAFSTESLPAIPKIIAIFGIQIFPEAVGEYTVNKATHSNRGPPAIAVPKG